MSKSKIIAALLASAAFSVAVQAKAQSSAEASALSPERFAVGFSVGSDGIGGDLQYSLNRYITLRGRGTWLQFNYAGNTSDLHYKGKFDLSQGGGYVDLHPFANPFTVSVGAAAGARKVDLSAFYRHSVTINHIPVPAGQLGTVGGDASLSSPAPFVGVGFDNTFTTRSRFGFKFLVGASFSHAPDVNLAPQSGLILQNPTIVAPAIVQAQSEIRHDGQVFQYFPEVSAGVTYKF